MSTLPTISDLRSYYEAGTSRVGARGLIEWPDQAGDSNLHFQKNANIEVRRDALNALPVIQFEGGSLSSAPVALPQPFTVVLVSDVRFRTSHSRYSTTPSLFGDSDSSILLRPVSKLRRPRISYSFGEEAISTGKLSPGFHVMSFVVSPTGVLRVDGEQRTLEGSIGSEGLEKFIVGHKYFHGDIAEIAVYARGLDSSELTTLENHFFSKYALASAANRPVANAGGSQEVQPLSTVNLDGTNSTDAFGYQWDFLYPPGGRTLNPADTNSAPSFQATAGGVFYVSLTVTNGSGVTDLDIAEIDVIEAPVLIPAITLVEGVAGMIAQGTIEGTATIVAFDENEVNLVATSSLTAVGDVETLFEGVATLSGIATANFAAGIGQEGQASLSAAATLAADLLRDVSVTLDLTANASVAAVGTFAQLGGVANLVGTATLDSVAGTAQGGLTVLDGTGLTTAGAGFIAGATSTLSSTASLSADGDLDSGATANLAADAQVTADAGLIASDAGPTTLAADAQVAADGTLEAADAITLTGTAALSADLSAVEIASLQSTASVSATAEVVAQAISNLTGTAALTGDLTAEEGALLEATGTVTADGTVDFVGNAGLAADASVTADGDVTAGDAVTLTGTATLSADAGLQAGDAITLSGDATVTATSAESQSGTTNLSGTATLTSDGALQASGDSTLSTTATITADGGQVQGGVSSVTADASITPLGALVAGDPPTLSADASVTAVGELQVAGVTQEGVATLSASAAITATEDNLESQSLNTTTFERDPGI